ncbi:hypothetical protein I2I05_08540 [Hymenobacter sp. BT683]|uniref:DUF2793 domain-containing protein n=1 Tax=Hymenobacter jeongseonensis TaxID=2791027 RepID=A0ABS0IGF6_9BACT|nr:hypothetical protein [Hymenobacter jeongseonensis]MBF9237444.1 hypothetical protein [Hymenobacter jeongseonensis]
MNSFLQNGLDNRPVLSLTGARCVLLVNRNAVIDVAPSTDDVMVLDDVYLVTGTKWNLFNEPENLSFTCEPAFSPAGTVYNVSIGFTATILTSAKSQLFRSMAKTKLTGVVQDKNNRWWLVGAEQALSLVEAPRRIDQDVNQYTVKITGTQLVDARQMSQTWVSALTDASFTDMVDAIDGGTSLVVLGADANGNSGGGTTIFLGNNFQNTITSPPSGYVIPSTIGMVFANSGTVVNLPANALVGQQHTVKDFSGGAYMASITINGNGHAIDGSPGPVKISTEYGAMTFTYADSGWMTNAFVN